MATGAPGTNGVWQYGEDDSEATFSALLNKAASTTNTQIGLDRARLTTLEAKPLSGLVPIIPTSIVPVTGTAAQTSTGAVNYTGCTAIQLNNVFTSAYKNYLIVISGQKTGASSTFFTRLVSSGTVINTNYSGGYSWIYYGATTIGGASIGTAAVDLIPATYDKYAASLTIAQPQEAVGTKFTGTSLGSQPANGCYAIIGAEHNASTQFQGIYFATSAGTMTGQIQVLGYND